MIVSHELEGRRERKVRGFVADNGVNSLASLTVCDEFLRNYPHNAGVCELRDIIRQHVDTVAYDRGVRVDPVAYDHGVSEIPALMEPCFRQLREMHDALGMTRPGCEPLVAFGY